MDTDWIAAAPDAPSPLLGATRHHARRSTEFTVPAHTLAVLGVVASGALHVSRDGRRWEPVPPVFAEGCRTTATRYRAEAGTRWIGCLARADAWAILAPRPARPFVDRLVPATPETLGAWLPEDDRRVTSSRAPDTRALARRWLARLDQALRAAPARAATARLDAAMAGLGLHDLPELAPRLDGSERALQRLFARELGVPAKFVQRLARLHRTLALWEHRGPDIDTLADLAAAGGYTDQAHLAREFRTLVGSPPRVLKAGAEPDGEMSDTLWALREGARRLVPGLFGPRFPGTALSEIAKPGSAGRR